MRGQMLTGSMVDAAALGVGVPFPWADGLISAFAPET